MAIKEMKIQTIVGYHHKLTKIAKTKTFDQTAQGRFGVTGTPSLPWEYKLAITQELHDSNSTTQMLTVALFNSMMTSDVCQQEKARGCYAEPHSRTFYSDGEESHRPEEEQQTITQ